MEEPRGWYSRGYLPHIDAGARTQFITWRLADSLPAQIIENWRIELGNLPDSEQKRELYRRVESYLDAGHGSSLLKNPVAASEVQRALLFDHQRKYELHAWVIMPNHVHVLLTLNEGSTLQSTLRTLKSVTATYINRTLSREGRLWQPDYFDRLIRDAGHFMKVAHYIEWNPVKAGLCTDPTHWPYSSASKRGFDIRKLADQASADRDAD